VVITTYFFYEFYYNTFNKTRGGSFS